MRAVSKYRICFCILMTWHIHLGACDWKRTGHRAESFYTDMGNAFLLCRLLGRTQITLSQIISKGRDSLNLTLTGKKGNKLEVCFPAIAFLHCFSYVCMLFWLLMVLYVFSIIMLVAKFGGGRAFISLIVSSMQQAGLIILIQKKNAYHCVP